VNEGKEGVFAGAVQGIMRGGEGEAAGMAYRVAKIGTRAWSTLAGAAA